MTGGAGTVTETAVPQTARRFQFDKRYLAPVLVTMVLVAGQVSFGFLESWSRTMLAIVTAIVVETAARPRVHRHAGRTWRAPT